MSQPQQPGPPAGTALSAFQDRLWRRLRLSRQRNRLAGLLEIVLTARSDVQRIVPRGLGSLPSYLRLADEGVTHALVTNAGGTLIVVAATTRVWRNPRLKRGLLAIKRDATHLGQRVLLVSQRGLERAVARQQRSHTRPLAARNRARTR